MKWTDLGWVWSRQKVARLNSAGDLLSSSGPVALFPVGAEPPRLRPGTWVTTSPMTETVKRVDADDLVVETVPRQEFQVVGFPVVVPASLARLASDPDDLLRLALATGDARPLEP